MLRKLGIAGVIAGAALTMSVAPAHAGGVDQQFNQNLQGIPIQLCNANIGGGVIAAAIPIASPQTTGDCINGPVASNFN